MIKFTPSPTVNDWYETVKLAELWSQLYRRTSIAISPIPDTWFKMRDIPVVWASKGVDGFRCDMAEMVPVEFWNWTIPSA